MGWLKKRIALAVMFERIDHCAKKPTPKTANMDEKANTICLKSKPQITARMAAEIK